jgi:hypothetical protein
LEKQIKDCARKITATLMRLAEANILRLPEQLSERRAIIYQALGWLAREGMINYKTRGSQIYVSLRSDGRETSGDRRRSI